MRGGHRAVEHFIVQIIEQLIARRIVVGKRDRFAQIERCAAQRIGRIRRDTFKNQQMQKVRPVDSRIGI